MDEVPPHDVFSFSAGSSTARGCSGEPAAVDESRPSAASDTCPYDLGHPAGQEKPAWVEPRPWRELRPARELIKVPWAELAIDERTKVKHWYRWTYLDTKGWRARRDAAKRAAGGCCERCGVKGTGRQKPDSVLHVHHRNYDHLGAEQWPRDLEVVCAACHRVEHGVGR